MYLLHLDPRMIAKTKQVCFKYNILSLRGTLADLVEHRISGTFVKWEQFFRSLQQQTAYCIFSKNSETFFFPFCTT